MNWHNGSWNADTNYCYTFMTSSSQSLTAIYCTF